jgi:hypothetical protein
VATTSTVALPRLLVELAFHKVPHFAATLAHQGDHRDVHLCSPHQRGKQRWLAAARLAENPDTLAFAAGRQTVDGPHAERKHLVDQAALQGWRRWRLYRPTRARRERRSIERPAEAIQHPAKQGVADGDTQDVSSALDFGAGGKSQHFADGRQDDLVSIQPDDLRKQRFLLPAIAQPAQIAKPCAG